MENKNPNHPLGRGIFNVGNSLYKKIENNPNVASEGVFPTNKDWMIISQLRADARRPVTSISSTVHLCREAVRKRIEQYDPIIKKYTVILDFKKIGLVHIMMNVSINKEKEVFEKYMQQHHCLNNLYQTTKGYAIEMIFQNSLEADNFIEALSNAFVIEEKQVWLIEKQLAQECFLERGRHNG